MLRGLFAAPKGEPGMVKGRFRCRDGVSSAAAGARARPRAPTAARTAAGRRRRRRCAPPAATARTRRPPPRRARAPAPPGGGPGGGGGANDEAEAEGLLQRVSESRHAADRREALAALRDMLQDSPQVRRVVRGARGWNSNGSAAA
jgi:hypothetical protein